MPLNFSRTSLRWLCWVLLCAYTYTPCAISISTCICSMCAKVRIILSLMHAICGTQPGQSPAFCFPLVKHTALPKYSTVYTVYLCPICRASVHVQPSAQRNGTFTAQLQLLQPQPDQAPRGVTTAAGSQTAVLSDPPRPSDVALFLHTSGRPSTCRMDATECIWC